MATIATGMGGQNGNGSGIGRGAGQAPGRAHNERLILSHVRRHGSLPKAEIARLTGLSPQSASVIMRRLEEDRLLVRGAPVRGRVGQPSIPMGLNPEGVFSIGLKIGRRSAELVLMDFVGGIRMRLHETYGWPVPEAILAFVGSGVSTLAGTLKPDERDRIAGLGVAVPFELWNWAEAVGAPKQAMDTWRDVDLVAEIAAIQPFPVTVENDATAACGAELVFGRGADHHDFIYFFVGYFIGGGVVLDGTLYRGRTGNAGAVGSMPVPGDDGKPVQLINAASILMLERALKRAGRNPPPLWLSLDDWSDFGAELDGWVGSTARSLAHAIVASCSVIDFAAAVIDGGFPTSVRARLVDATRDALGGLDLQGIVAPEIVEGAVGSGARAVGGACLPLFDRFLIDQRSLLKDAVR